MTLLVAAHCGKDLVVGSDTLVTINRRGKTIDDTNSKIFKMNKHTAMMVAGRFEADMNQFIKDYAYNHRTDTNIVALRDGVVTDPNLPKLGKDQRIQLCFAGYAYSQPDVRILILEYEKAPKSSKLENNYFAAGYEKPARRAEALLLEKEINKARRTVEIKQIVRESLLQCIEEYKDDKDERLGGSPEVVVLRKS